MRSHQLTWVFIGLSITSSWGNGHATTYRALLAAIRRLGHRVVFLERGVPWYRSNADMPAPPFCETIIYDSLNELYLHHAHLIESADVCVVGSYVPDGSKIAEFVTRTCRGVTAFYDIDTPVTLRGLAQDDCAYLKRVDIPEFDLYLSFTGGPTLRKLCLEYGAKRAEPLYCSVDPALYHPSDCRSNWVLGYLGTYSDDRQPALNRLLCDVARRLPEKRFIVAGPQYPESIDWPSNVDRLAHVSPQAHCHFYCSQRATLNVTRQDMVEAGYSPSVRLFEAAACGVPVISDTWAGIESFFDPDTEILLAEDTSDVLRHLETLTPERRRQIGERARQRVLREHTAEHRASALESVVLETLANKVPPKAARVQVRATEPRMLASEVGK